MIKSEYLSKNTKTFDEFLLRFSVSSGARCDNLVETLLDLTFFPESPPIPEKPPNRSFSNREHAFSLSLSIFEFLNFYKTAGDGGVGRAGISGTPPGPPVASVNRHFPNKERIIFIIYPGRFHARNLPAYSIVKVSFFL